MNTTEIDQNIKLAMSFKHQGNIKQALSIEEECLKRVQKEKGTTLDGIAILFKGLGKLYYVEKRYDKARDFFAAATELFLCLCFNVNPGYEPEVGNCAFFLGTCSKNFLGTKAAEELRRGLETGGGAQYPLTQQMVQQLAQEGLSLVQQLSPDFSQTVLTNKILGRRL